MPNPRDCSSFQLNTALEQDSCRRSDSRDSQSCCRSNRIGKHGREFTTNMMGFARFRLWLARSRVAANGRPRQRRGGRPRGLSPGAVWREIEQHRDGAKLSSTEMARTWAARRIWVRRRGSAPLAVASLSASRYATFRAVTMDSASASVATPDPSNTDKPIPEGSSPTRLGSEPGITATMGLPSARAAPASKKALFACAVPGSGTTSTTPSEASKASRRARSKLSPGRRSLSSDQTLAPRARMRLPSRSAKGRSARE